jgi:hypothetical protein
LLVLFRLLEKRKQKMKWYFEEIGLNAVHAMSDLNHLIKILRRLLFLFNIKLCYDIWILDHLILIGGPKIYRL